MSTIRKVKRQRKSKVMQKVKVFSRHEYKALELDSRLLLIQQLVPLGMMLVAEELQREVEVLAGVRYQRKETSCEAVYRHGTNMGSVKLAGQRMRVDVPRLRGPKGEVPLQSYERLHQGTTLDETLFRRVLYGISCRNYEAAVEALPGAIGLSPSTVSKQFLSASREQLKLFQERDLSGLDLVALFLDGKKFADDTMVIALGVTLSGEKVFLGFVQTDTENSRVLSEFLRSLVERGLDLHRGVLAIIDGGKGLRAALRHVFQQRVVVQRCQWHKRENVVSYLSKTEQPGMRHRLQRAYERPTYEEARQALLKIRQDLEERNQSACASLDEGFEETLTLHRLGVFSLLGRSFKTTNCLESINAMAEERCAKVDYWKNSNQKQRWLAAALLDIEPRLQRVRGHKHLALLREAIMKELNLAAQDKAA